MRIVQYLTGTQVACGVQVGNDVFATGYDDTLDLIRDGERGLERAAAARAGDPVRVDRIIHPARPGTIFGSGVNYTSHGDEDPDYVPADELRWDFTKLSVRRHRPRRGHRHPSQRRRHQARARRHRGPLREYGFAVDYEVEFGVVIGKTAKNVRAEDALDYVFGYTVINDVGARSVQFHNYQIDLGKNFDTFCPMGPCIVTKDELPDWENVRVQSYVNGELRQDALRPRADRATARGDRVAQLHHHAAPRRRASRRDPARLRHLHEPAGLPQAGRRRHRLGLRNRRADESRRGRHGAHVPAQLSRWAGRHCRPAHRCDFKSGGAFWGRRTRLLKPRRYQPASTGLVRPPMRSTATVTSSPGCR